MFAPLRTWRKWHRKVNTTQKRHAVASALAASACAPLVLARGHDVNAVPELPLVVDSLNVDSSTKSVPPPPSFTPDATRLALARTR
jgi:large subunit ribosomal protein L4e